MELRDEVSQEWQKLDGYWDRALEKKAALEASVEESAQVVKEDMKQLMGDIKIGYEKLKQSLKS